MTQGSQNINDYKEKTELTFRILHNSGKLGGDDWNVMKTHASIGHVLLKSSDREILKAIAVIAGQYHEHWNGKGYPDRLKGEEIHLYT